MFRFTKATLSIVMLITIIAPLAHANEYEEFSPYSLAIVVGEEVAMIDPLEATLIEIGTDDSDGSVWALYEGGITMDSLRSNLIAVGTVGTGGAPWALFDDGVLYIGTGFINWTSYSSPWIDYSSLITEIIFTGSITAGTSLIGLFAGLYNVVTIEGLAYFDTSSVTDMSAMFERTISLTSLDVSSWDTSNVTNMSFMFSVVRSLTSLDLSNWDTSNVTNMSYMFQDASSLINLNILNWDTSSVVTMNWMFTSGTSALRNLTLGERFLFRSNANLPSIPPTTEFTGYWQNVGTGTIDSPNGRFVLTSAELMAWYNGTMADTFVWQRAQD